MKNLNCYIHIPFCSSKCKYCRFASFWFTQDLQIQNYINSLIDEIDSFNYSEPVILDTIYFWWWTPWVLKLDQFNLVLDKLKSKFSFSDDIEISIETTPNNVTIDNIIWWKNLWINRVSIWVQSLNTKTLETIERWNKWDVITAFDNIKKSWLDMNISIDFIIWLPYVKKWDIEKDLDFIFKNYDFIKHVSVYMLEEYYDVPEEKESSFDNIVYPDNWWQNSISEDQYEEEYNNIKSFLEKKWFHRYEISNYSKKWFECKHNIWYWNHKENLAFWLWSHWFLDNTRFANSEMFLDYYARKNIKKEKLNQDDIFLEKMLFQIRTFWIDIKYMDKLDKEKIDYFISLWFLIIEEDKIKITDKSIVYMDYILSEII